jgi:hypothetical protein
VRQAITNVFSYIITTFYQCFFRRNAYLMVEKDREKREMGGGRDAHKQEKDKR